MTSVPTEKGEAMTDREKLIAWIRDVSKFHEEVKEKWILGGKQGERPSLIASIADHLIANGVVCERRASGNCTQVASTADAEFAKRNMKKHVLT